MQSPPVLEVDRLASPIADGAPTGVELRSADEASYWAVKDHYSKAQSIEASLAKGNEPDPDNPLDWGVVLDACTEAIEQKTKDLEVAAYLLVAAFRVHGLPGLRDGFRLIRALVESYWDNLYPPLDIEETSSDGEPVTSAATRVKTLDGVNSSTLIRMLEDLPVASSSRLGDFSYLQYKDALTRKRESALSDIRQAAAETDAAYYRTLAADLKACQEEFRLLTAALDERCGKESPRSSRMTELLRELNEYVRLLAGDKLKEAEAAPAEADGEPGQPAAAGKAAAPGGIGVLKTREDAFLTLRKVAEYFRQTDPHSFLAYALERVIRWGQMPLPQLLEELISVEDSRREVFRLVGIEPPKPPEEPSSSYSS
jgi:type VI secretion system protein ImpA